MGGWRVGVISVLWGRVGLGWGWALCGVGWGWVVCG